MDFKIWLSYVFTELVLDVTPGPAVMLIISQGLRSGPGTSALGALGISTGNLFYFILSALGLGSLIIEAENVFEIVKIAGACYLIFLGAKMSIPAFAKKTGIPPQVRRQPERGNAFFMAFVTQISNPKAILFFIALLPQFIDPKENLLQQTGILALTTIFLETGILITYGWISAKGGHVLSPDSRARRIIDLIGGGVLIGIGINLFFSGSMGKGSGCKSWYK